MFTVLLTTIIYGTWTTHSTDLDCNDAFECVGRSLNDTGHTAFNGYKSGFGPTTSWHGGTTICRAAFSCDSMAFLTSISGADEYIRCEGASSCANTTITTSYDCTCYGANSCVYAQISATETNAIVQCNADQSCSFAHINNTETVHGAGAYALYNAMIDTQGIDRSTFTIDLSADYAAYGATLTCRSGHTCNIYCYGYKSCFMFYVNCIGNCIIITRFNGKNTIAPITNFTQFDANPSIPLLQDSMSFITRNEQLCNTQGMNSDDYDERRNVDIVMDTEGPICCRGRSSCIYSVIQYQGITGQYVICSGFNACHSSRIDSNNGHVFCGAREACHLSMIVNSDIVYCLGMSSCLKATITKSSNVLCFGSRSCWLADIISNGTDLNVNFTAYRAAESANIYCNVSDLCTVVCSGYESCLNTALYCDGLCDVQCDAFSGCPIGITLAPTTDPTLNPTQYPTSNPTVYPSSQPTQFPSFIPTYSTQQTSNATRNPSSNPLHSPSFNPAQHLSTYNPSFTPTVLSSQEGTLTESDHIDDLETTIVWMMVLCLILTAFAAISIFVLRNKRRKKASVSVQQQVLEMTAPKLQEVILKVNSTSNVNSKQKQNNAQTGEQDGNKMEYSRSNESSTFSADIPEGVTSSGTIKIKFPKKRTKGQFL
eukprot:1051103_1